MQIISDFVSIFKYERILCDLTNAGNDRATGTNEHAAKASIFDKISGEAQRAVL